MLRGVKPVDSLSGSVGLVRQACLHHEQLAAEGAVPQEEGGEGIGAAVLGGAVRVIDLIEERTKYRFDHME
jgi:hypothetical protein